jgi:hypothetical protein
MRTKWLSRVLMAGLIGGTVVSSVPAANASTWTFDASFGPAAGRETVDAVFDVTGGVITNLVSGSISGFYNGALTLLSPVKIVPLGKSDNVFDPGNTFYFDKKGAYFKIGSGPDYIELFQGAADNHLKLDVFVLSGLLPFTATLIDGPLNNRSLSVSEQSETERVSANPLPSTWTMMLLGLACFGFVAYRRQKHNAALAAA